MVSRHGCHENVTWCAARRESWKGGGPEWLGRHVGCELIKSSGNTAIVFYLVKTSQTLVVLGIRARQPVER